MTRSARVLWLTDHYYPGGGGMARSCDRIVHGLRQAGVVVDVAHLSRRAPEVTVASRRNGRDIRCGLGDDPAHALNALWNWLAADACRQHLTHVVAFGGQTPLLAGPVFAAWLGLPLVTLLRGNDFDIGVFAPGREAALREAVRRSAAVCVVSRDKVWKVRALYPEIEPVWIPNGIDLDEVASAAVAAGARGGLARRHRASGAPCAGLDWADQAQEGWPLLAGGAARLRPGRLLPSVEHR